jgi:hypothetical protein
MYDGNEFVVDSILNHRGDRNRRTQMEFLVRWSGFPSNTTHGKPMVTSGIPIS